MEEGIYLPNWSSDKLQIEYLPSPGFGANQIVTTGYVASSRKDNSPCSLLSTSGGKDPMLVILDRYLMNMCADDE
jgi:hypothetical protein